MTTVGPLARASLYRARHRQRESDGAGARSNELAASLRGAERRGRDRLAGLPLEVGGQRDGPLVGAGPSGGSRFASAWGLWLLRRGSPEASN